MFIRWALLLVAVCWRFADAQTTKHEDIHESHGTVNIILANGDTLVAVTDSMLTFASRSHKPGFAKLFRIDDRTLCTLAGFYSQPGPNGINKLAAFVPQMISDFSKEMTARMANKSELPFRLKAKLLLDSVQFPLSSNVQSLAAADALSELPSRLELTLAGYDRDNSLQIAEITLTPMRTSTGVEFASTQRPHGPFIPLCELSASVLPPSERLGDTDTPPRIVKVGSALFCDVAGLPNVAEKMLDKPYMFPAIPLLQNYAKAKADGRPLTVSELQALALELEQQTAADQKRTHSDEVGGAPQMATLTGGKLSGNFIAPLEEKAGEDLGGLHASAGEYDCEGRDSFPYARIAEDQGLGGSVFLVPEGSQFSVSLFNCRQDIDGLIFHDSSFTHSQIYYGGRGLLIFDKNNLALDTSLELGLKVDLNSEAVHKLICGFHWKSILQGGAQLKDVCRIPAIKP